ncbi:hypothetical protein D9M70_536010 [compost metagenome]
MRRHSQAGRCGEYQSFHPFRISCCELGGQTTSHRAGDYVRAGYAQGVEQIAVMLHVPVDRIDSRVFARHAEARVMWYEHLEVFGQAFGEGQTMPSTTSMQVHQGKTTTGPVYGSNGAVDLKKLTLPAGEVDAAVAAGKQAHRGSLVLRGGVVATGL